MGRAGDNIKRVFGFKGPFRENRVAAREREKDSPRHYIPLGEIAGSCSSVAFDGGAVNRLFRRFAGRGARVMVILRPVIFGSISTCDIPERSSRTLCTSCIPNS